MTYNFLAVISGGLGPDVWDKELQISACDIQDALSQAIAFAQERAGQVFSVEENDWPKWTQVPPQAPGLYWLWYGGEEDGDPFPVEIMSSGTSGKCFVAMGQHGWTRAQEFEELEGSWWMRCHPPALPNKIV